MNLYRDHLASTSLGKGEGVDKENQKVTEKGGRAVKKVMSLTHIPLCTFFCNSSLFNLGFSSSPGNITASIKKSSSKKVSTSIFEITIKYLYKNIIPPLCQCELFIQNVCLKIQLRL